MFLASGSRPAVSPAICLVILGTLLAYNGVQSVDPCTVNPNVSADVDNPYAFDPCYSAGFFQSNTILRMSTVAGKSIFPYDYYQCVPYGTTFLRYTQRCSSNYIFYKDADDMEMYLNAFDNSTKKCSTQLPTGATPYECMLPAE